MNHLKSFEILSGEFVWKRVRCKPAVGYEFRRVGIDKEREHNSQESGKPQPFRYQCGC